MPAFQMRQTAKSLDNPSSYFVYGDKYAVINMNGRTNFIFTVWDIPGLADTFRLHFLSLWNDAVLFKNTARQRERQDRQTVAA